MTWLWYYLVALIYLEYVHGIELFQVCKSIFWLHVPKTSSSFCLSINHACCKTHFEEITQNVSDDAMMWHNSYHNTSFRFVLKRACVFFKPYDQYKPKWCFRYAGGGHAPYPIVSNEAMSDILRSNPTRPREPASRIYYGEDILGVAIFRDPKSRIISAFFDSYHHEGMNKHDYFALKLSPNKLESANMSQVLESLHKFANHPNIMACQTKMLLGLPCCSNSLTFDVINTTAIEQAKKKLHKLFFVGIFEDYRRSIDLFHRMANSSTVAHLIENIPQRVSKLRTLKRKLFELFEYFDPYDAIIYQEAREIYDKNLQLYF